MESITNNACYAGLFDGEGCSYGGAFGGSPAVRTTIANSNLQVLSDIHRDFGGILQNQTKVEGRKQVYNLVFNGKKGKEFLEAILPYLRIKREQVVLTLEFITRMTVREDPRKLEIIEELKVINRRGEV